MMKLTCIVFALAIVGIYADEQIVNGVPTTIEENPHVVTIQLNGNHFCGGSIIGPRTILTAGHCVDPFIRNEEMKDLAKICTGTTYLDKATNCFGIEKLHLHHDYNGHRDRIGADIGIIRLSDHIEFDKHQKPILLPYEGVHDNEDIEIVAWGSKGFRKPIHNDLQKLNVKSMSWDRCQAYHWSTGMRINHDEFCSLSTMGTGTCHGDSGSGVVRVSDGRIIGLVSNGIPCAEGYPDVYTDVYKHINWIEMHMRYEP